MKIEVAGITREELERAEVFSGELQLLCIEQSRRWQEEFPDDNPYKTIFWTALAAVHTATAAMHAMYGGEPGHDHSRLYRELISALNQESERIYVTLVSQNQ